MTKESLKLSAKRILSDHTFVWLIAAIVLACVIYCIVIGFTIQPRDVQVYVRYTGFGLAHFYKNPWQYTLLFVGFGVLVTTVHIALMAKLHGLERRQTAIIIGWSAIVILFIASVYALSILRLAFR